MTADYIPAADAESLVWMRNYATFLISHGPANGLVGPYNSLPTDVNNAFLLFESTVRDLAAAEAAARAAVQAKNAARANAERLIRLSRQVMLPNLDPAERAAAGLAVPDLSPTPKSAPTSRPVGRIDASKPLAHALRFVDADTPTRRAKPPGVRHIEVWLKIGDPKPTGPADMQFIGIATRPPFAHNFTSADAGKMAHYLLRWVSTRNAPGPWSELHSATIAGV